MRIERRQHPVDRRLDQFLVIGLIDVTVTHLVEDFAEDREPLVGAARGSPQRVARSARQEHANSNSIRKVGESFSHRTTLSSVPGVRLHQFGLSPPVWAGSLGAAVAEGAVGAADAAGAAAASVLAGAASALTAGSGIFTPCKRSIAAVS